MWKMNTNTIMIIITNIIMSTIMNMVNVMTLTVIVMSIIMSAMTHIVIATTMAMSMG